MFQPILDYIYIYYSSNVSSATISFSSIL